MNQNAKGKQSHTATWASSCSHQSATCFPSAFFLYVSPPTSAQRFQPFPKSN